MLEISTVEEALDVYTSQDQCMLYTSGPDRSASMRAMLLAVQEIIRDRAEELVLESFIDEGSRWKRDTAYWLLRYGIDMYHAAQSVPDDMPAE